MGRLDTTARARLDTWRKSAGMTQRELAERIERNPVWISRYFDDAYDASLDTLERMAVALGHTLNELLGEVPSDAEGELIERFRACDPESRALVLQMLRKWTPDAVWPSDAPTRVATDDPTPTTTRTPSKRGTRKR
jgi:transcriptional regulator with XRE-family HTH domain